MTITEKNQNDAPYGYMLDPATGQLRPKKRAGRPRVHQVADEADPEAYLEARRKSVRANQESFYARNPGLREAYAAAWREDNRDKFRRYNRKSMLKLKREVMDAYGGACACCGETELVFLTIDHIDGNGAEHRREMAAKTGSKWGQAGHNTYRWLRKNGFPEGFQVLCANCNCGRHWNGGICPHQEKAEPPAEVLAGGPVGL